MIYFISQKEVIEALSESISIKHYEQKALASYSIISQTKLLNAMHLHVKYNDR